jgi:transposase
MNTDTDLSQKVQQLQGLLTAKEALLTAKDQRIQQLEELLLSYRHKQFGPSSEANPQQGGLFNEAEVESEARSESEDVVDDTATVEVAGHQRRRKPRVSIPTDLPREDILHDLADNEKVCPHDGTALTCIGEQTSEQLDIIPAQVKVLRHIRKKYACPCCEQYLVTANKPKQPIEKSIAAPGLLAHIAISKYADALPLYRQTQMFKRLGLELDRTNLANWMIRCGELVQPLINLLQERLHEEVIVHMDETPIQVLQETGKTAQSQSYMWVQASMGSSTTPVMLFHYAPSRTQSVPLAQLESYQGALMVDGYEGYQAVCQHNQLTRLGCWAHARRKFVEAKRAQPKGKTGKADQALAFIQKLYALERQTKDAPPEKRYLARQQRAKPVIEKIKQWLDKSLPQVPPKTAMGKALGYLQNQWPRLIAYLDKGEYPIDNNRAENAIRPFVIGRKNWLFSASVGGAKASANLYSLIETAKANGLEPYSYLRQVFTQLPSVNSIEDVEALLPWQQMKET